MVQLVVNDIFLDLYENDPPKLTYSIEDLLDTKVTSVYSKTFRVPATKQNTRFFKSAFEINGFDFDVTVKVDASILLNGSELRKGQIRLQKIYLTNEGNAADYEIIFLGESRNFASDVGPGFISDLDYSELDTALTYANISASWAAYPQSSSLTAGLHSGSLLFPLVDFGNTYSGSTVEQTRIAVGTGRHITNPAQTWPLQVTRFRPMVRAKFIWDKIFEEAGYTYDSEFLTSDRFLQQYVSAWGNEPFVDIATSSSINLFRASDLLPNENNVQLLVYSDGALEPTNISLVGQGYPGTSNQFNAALGEIYDYGGNYAGGGVFPGGFYTAPSSGQYRFRYDILLSLVFATNSPTFSFNYRLKRYRPSTGVTTTVFTENVIQSSNIWAPLTTTLPYSYQFGTYSKTVLTTATAGDQYYLEVNIGSIGDILEIRLNKPGSKFECITAPGGELAIGSFIKDDYKKIDFIKDIITKYRLVFAPDPTNLTNFKIEPWERFIGTGDVYDWTNLLDYSKDIVVEPVFNTQKAKIKFTDKEDKDWLNALNVTQFNEVFGAALVDPQNELLTDEREVKTTLAPTPVRQIQGFSETSTVADDFIIPHIYTIESTEEGVKYNPIEPTTRLLFYNGMKSGNDTWYAQAEGAGTTYTLTQYPMVSPYSDWPIVGGTLDLNWERENGYQYVSTSIDDTPQFRIGKSVYNVYWEPYITSLYNKWSRKVTAYFTLDGNDLREFGFDDIIYVKGTYYYVETIYDVPLDRREPVKVDLIKYPYIVPNTNFIPPVEVNVWGEWLVDWDTTTDTWDD
jgi:hypothetical protein